MKTTIPIERLFRVIGDGYMPIGDILTRHGLTERLPVTVGVKVIDIRTKENVYLFNKDKWQWELVEAETAIPTL